jgi:hypothetical protein
MTHAQAVEKQAPERYLLDEMPELERYAFEEHFFTCPECAEDVRTGALMREAVGSGLLPAAASAVQTTPTAVQATPTAASPAAPPAAAGWRSTLPWAVAAMLALTVGYQSLWVVPGLRDQGVGAQALAPITLRAATRGAEPTIARPATGVITFALDANGNAPGTALSYDLRTADGASVASGTASAPPAGTPLLLMVPAAALHTTGSYVLSIRDGANSGAAAAEYRFTLSER